MDSFEARARTALSWGLFALATIWLFVSRRSRSGRSRQLLNDNAWADSSDRSATNDEVRGATLAEAHRRIGRASRCEARFVSAAAAVAGSRRRVRRLSITTSAGRRRQVLQRRGCDALSEREQARPRGCCEGSWARPRPERKQFDLNGEVTLDLDRLLRAGRRGLVWRQAECERRFHPGQNLFMSGPVSSRSRKTSVKILKALISRSLESAVLRLFALAIYLARVVRLWLLGSIWCESRVLAYDRLPQALRGGVIVDSLVRRKRTSIRQRMIGESRRACC